MDQTSRSGGVKFLLAFAGWATLVFVPAWWVAHPWQHAIGAMASRIAAPRGAELEMIDLELFYPMDLGVFVALCLATLWTSWPRRLRAILIGTPIMVIAEIAALSLALAALLGAGDPASQAEASRWTDAVIRITGLAVAAAVWFVVLGRTRLGSRV